MSYELRSHTADVAVAAEGPTLDAVFAAVADGLAAAMAESVPDTGNRFSLRVRAESRDATLFDYLDELIYERDVREVLPVENRATVHRDGDEWVVDADARGVPLAGLGAREVKAVTYSEMRLEETADGWRAYVVFDV
ncbi:archease [Haloprofundus salinisoli]|uniref:archease n=1 Tax=Haloprofundus salinisoli TaxID=2876193 RepID=UPI001CCC2B41|nr:archease [Haloprofundus salinisoli]